jgi:tetratricopeptide (TPR) repeat protein
MNNTKQIEQFYTVTTEPVANKYLDNLPPRMIKLMNRFHDNIMINPKKTAKEIEKIDIEYRNHPLFINYLITCYKILKKYTKVKQLAKTSYVRNKDYLFAKINYAEECLLKKDYKEFENIFENKFSLSKIYPDRVLFHISEVKPFLYLMGRYHFEINEIDNSKYFYKKLKELTPEDNAVKYLEMLYLVENAQENDFDKVSLQIDKYLERQQSTERE